MEYIFWSKDWSEMQLYPMVMFRCKKEVGVRKSLHSSELQPLKNIGILHTEAESVANSDRRNPPDPASYFLLVKMRDLRAPSERISSVSFENHSSSDPRLAKFCSGRSEQLYRPALQNCTISFCFSRSEAGLASRGDLKQVRVTSEALSE
ncbi:hypothetical protein Y032_0388g506 [Ancylostoma ceylanicum]|uniref:Uncharacterized protein n=1 Tax=Ancylostoma ceylanicum TaxID=53326 RepID=A0A016RSI6_9BILA|nr:hypothetical protein Y032_0388g506 [Ancylostoma ceylanicum]